MSEYERHSLALLTAIAGGLVHLASRPESGLDVLSRDREKLVHQWSQSVNQIMSQVNQALREDEDGE